MFDFDVWLGAIASLATITAVAVPVVRHFRHKGSEKIRVSKSLCLELEDAIAGLNPKKFPEDFYNTNVKDPDGRERKAYFMARSLNHDFYDSLISSGKINLLDPPLQQSAQNIFKRIKMHNKYVDHVLEMAEHSGNTVPAEAHKYCLWLEESEELLQKELPEILQSLERSR